MEDNTAKNTSPKNHETPTCNNSHTETNLVGTCSTASSGETGKNLDRANNTGEPQPTTPCAPITPEIDIETFAKVELRVATITNVEAVPKSKKLFQIQLDVGPLGERQIVSGIAKHYAIEDLIGRQIVVVANLKPAKLMGVESRGMLLAASTEGDETLAILNPDKPLPAGALVR